MAKKTGNRTCYKEVCSYNGNHETHSDEITLRDEILELKRQLVVLKRSNEQYLVKLRKYEDEAKRKDKQVEQLLDPRKNAEVTKMLSTKGAAILMNLKDQNDTLIQMILNKDLHIRRLLAEAKMSKLYATTRKNENYKTEINRLRNLLIKSQEALKENDAQQQAKSISATGNSFLEFSSSSDQSSPRDLDELRVTILSLESHIKQSNDLLAKKNQEISLLTNELNFLRKFFRYKTYKNKTFESDTEGFKNRRFSTVHFTNKWLEPLDSTKIFIPESFETSENNQRKENLPRSAPETSSKWSTSIESTPKCSFLSHAIMQTKQSQIKNEAEPSVINSTNLENFEKVSLLEKSFYHDLTTNGFLKEEKILTNSQKTTCAKEKWMKALIKYREISKTKLEISTGNQEAKNYYKQAENDSGEFLSIEGQQINEKMNETKPHTLEEDLENAVIEEPNGTKLLTPSTTDPAVCDNKDSKTCQNSESSKTKNEESLSIESTSCDEANLQNDGYLENQKEISKTFEFNFEEDENKMNSLRENRYRSFDSRFDSESSSSMSQEVRQMKVEVQINSFSPRSDKSGASISENNQIFECNLEENGNSAPDLFDFNDDEDVIIREK